MLAELLQYGLGNSVLRCRIIFNYRSYSRILGFKYFYNYLINTNQGLMVINILDVILKMMRVQYDGFTPS